VFKRWEDGARDMAANPQGLSTGPEKPGFRGKAQDSKVLRLSKDTGKGRPICAHHMLGMAQYSLTMNRYCIQLKEDYVGHLLSEDKAICTLDVQDLGRESFPVV
jgi:hypothetical protein